ncbi:MAG TPA: hypothetical protein DIU20_00255, partial [Cryomorphaceae bacterium]|nr:hypothetical protein [Cryomorphaceae bacterium]
GAPLTSAGGKCFSGNTYHGYMDDILIYSRNINSSEVAALYNDTSSICSNIGMKDAVQTSILSLYPNPTHNYFTIEMIDNQTFKSVIIMDQTGKIIGQEVGTFIGSHTVNTTNLSSGIYTVLVQTGNNKIARLLVKE